MRKFRRMYTGLALGLLALTLLAAAAVVVTGQPTASAAPAAQTATTTPTPATTPGAKKDLKNNAGELSEAFARAFAARLGIDQAKLNAAFTGAVGDVADQAVKDGKITQAQADKIKEAAKDGFKGGPFAGKFGHPNNKGKKPHGPALAGDLIKNSLDVAAGALGVTPDALKAELKAGKSIADVAKARNVDLQKVKDALLAAAKARLDQAVKDGKLTQAQADKLYQAATGQLDRLLNASPKAHPRKGR